MNVELLQKLKRDILERPEGFDMLYNSTCLKSRLANSYVNRYEGMRLLDITEEQGNNLFRMGHDFIYWPNGLEERLDCAKPGTPEYAQVVADYIDYLISTEEPTGPGPETEKEELVLCH